MLRWSSAALIIIEIVNALTICLAKDVIPGEFGKDVVLTVTGSDEGLSRLKYELTSKNDVVRVTASSYNATAEEAVLVVVRQPNAVLSFQVPLLLSNRYPYHSVSRTLCPTNMTEIGRWGHFYDHSPIYVEVSSYSSRNLSVTVRVDVVPNLMLQLNEHRNITVSPSQPQYFGFITPDELQNVVVNVRSDDDICLIVSIQDASCPVFDLDTNVMFTGRYETMTKKGATSVAKADLAKFFVVLVVKPNDYSCTKMAKIDRRTGSKEDIREKSLELWVEDAVGYDMYIIAITVTVAVYSLIYIITFAFMFFFNYKDKRDPKLQDARDRIHNSESNKDHLNTTRNPQYGSVNEHREADKAGPSSRTPVEAINGTVESTPGRNANQRRSDPEIGDQQQTAGRGDSSSDEDYDNLSDADKDKSIIRTKENLKVSDLSRKAYKRLSRKYLMYFWNLITIAIFYTLPVIQLVLIHQQSVTVTGNEDICYYNFECARPLGAIFAFNAVFSNVGYVLLGILFLMIVRHKDLQNQTLLREDEYLQTKFGVPRHFGLLYAMGVALAMEGILSASYHICPNSTNFQFDTAFMYMIAALGLLKLYQVRHPDINPHSHVSYVAMAFFILLAVIGVLFNSVALWIVFSVSALIFLFMISAEFYYKGQWRLDKGVFGRLYHEWCMSFRCINLKPRYPDRIIYILLCNAMNISFILWGLIQQPRGFAGFLLIIFISNLMLYMVFYVFMKLWSRERLKGRAILVGLLAAASWACSFVFYLQERTSWMVTPAQSREKNDKCILLGFYDTHDIWHFLSALSLFLSFVLVLVMDDDLMFIPQSDIVVF